MIKLNFLLLWLITTIISCKKTDISVDKEIIISDTPNIVFIIADDMGWDVFGNYPEMNGQKAKTPTLDSLAKNGLTFTNFWTNPECSPTRAAILTGKYGFRTGIGGVEAPPTKGLSTSETIIHKYITEKTNNAYATALIGKWHVSLNNELDAPENFGIQYYSGFLTGAVTDYYSWTQTGNGKQQNITTYATTHFVNQSIDWIKEQQKPFFLWLAFNAPHTPFHRPPLDLISDKTLSNNQATIDANPLPYYLASIEAMDKEIGRLIASLTATQRQNTVFVFIGDNGTPPRVAQLPFTRNTVKSTLFQGGINTPLIVSGVGVSRKNGVESSLIQAPDLFSTFADLAGTGTEKHQDGISFKPLLMNGNAEKRSYIYSELFTDTSTPNDGYTLRNSSYKYIKLKTGEEYFYNLQTDSFEKDNLINKTLSSDAQMNLDALKNVKGSL